jgi:hypothetical protein
MLAVAVAVLKMLAMLVESVELVAVAMAVVK